MNNTSKGYLKSIWTYLKLLPIVVIPVAGIILLTTAAPYYAVNRGCSILNERNRTGRRKIALSFGLSVATLLTLILLLLSYLLSPVMTLQVGEISIIALIYGVFILFSLLGSR